MLPKQVHRIKYYGFLANGKAGPQILAIRQILAERIEPGLEAAENSDPPSQCPVCSKGTMITVLVLDGHGKVVKETSLRTACIYQPRNPKASAYYKCVENHFVHPVTRKGSLNMGNGCSPTY